MYNRKYMFGLVVLLMFFSMSIVSSAPPVTTVQEFPDGYVLEESQHEYLKLNEDYQYNFFVFNQSSGLIITNSSTNCSFFLANSSGEVVLMQDVEYYNMYWGIDILGGNFSESGAYPYGVLCQGDYGGALAGIFEVTEGGFEITEGRSIMTIGLLMLLVFFLFLSLYSLFNMENYIGKFALYWVSHVLMIIITFVAWQIGVEGLLGGFALVGVFKTMFIIFSISAFPMLILSLAWIFYIHTFNEHFQKLVDKGVSTEEAFRMSNKKRSGWFHGK